MKVEHVVEKKKSYVLVNFALFLFGILFSGVQVILLMILKGSIFEHYFFFFSLVSSVLTIWVLTKPENQEMFRPIEVEEVVHKVTK